MAGAAPALLVKVARFRPRVVRFIRKGIWVHVGPLGPLLRHQIDDNTDNGDQGDGAGFMARTNKSCVALKEVEVEMDDSVMACTSSSVVVDNLDAPLMKAKPDPAEFIATSDPVRLDTEGGDVPQKASLGRSKSRGDFGQNAMSFIIPGKRRGVTSRRASSKKAAVLPELFYVDVQPHSVCSESERARKAVQHLSEHLRVRRKPSCIRPQRDDKVAFFKTLRRDLERIKTTTLETSSMQLTHLPNDVNGK